MKQDVIQLKSFPDASGAVIIGGSGGIGAALVRVVSDSKAFETIFSLSRSTTPPLDLLSEESIRDAATQVKERLEEESVPLRLLIVASGFLHDDRFMPEKNRVELDPDHMTRAFAINTIGPALVAKHFLPLLPREGRAVFAALSARVGSVGDNRMGGWYSYRASKAALNQIVRTSAVELARRYPDAVCVALHPGTVDTGLSEPFSKRGLDVRPPDEAAVDLLEVIDGLGPEDTGGFFDHKGKAVPW